MVQPYSPTCRKQGRESAVRNYDGTRHERHFVRLEPNIMDWFTTYGAVVGRSPYLHWLCPLLVDRPPYHVLQQCTFLLSRLPSVS